MVIDISLLKTHFKMRLLIFFLIIFNLSCKNDTQEIAIVVHGGAGTILKKNMTRVFSHELRIAQKTTLFF